MGLRGLQPDYCDWIFPAPTSIARCPYLWQGQRSISAWLAYAKEMYIQVLYRVVLCSNYLCAHTAGSYDNAHSGRWVWTTIINSIGGMKILRRETWVILEKPALQVQPGLSWDSIVDKWHDIFDVRHWQVLHNNGESLYGKVCLSDCCDCSPSSPLNPASIFRKYQSRYRCYPVCSETAEILVQA